MYSTCPPACVYIHRVSCTPPRILLQTIPPKGFVPQPKPAKLDLCKETQGVHLSHKPPISQLQHGFPCSHSWSHSQSIKHVTSMAAKRLAAKTNALRVTYRYLSKFTCFLSGVFGQEGARPARTFCMLNEIKTDPGLVAALPGHPLPNYRVDPPASA